MSKTQGQLSQLATSRAEMNPCFDEMTHGGRVRPSYDGVRRWLDLASDGTLTTRVGRATEFAVTIDLSGFKKNP